MIVIINENVLKEITSEELVGGWVAGPIGVGLARKLARDRIRFKEAYKDARDRCKLIKDKEKRGKCIRNALANYYKALAKIDQQALAALRRELPKASGIKKARIERAIKRLQKEFKYFNTIARLSTSPYVPISQLHKIAKKEAG